MLSRPDGKKVRKLMEQVVDEFGLPEAIRSDNGTPFASSGVAGLSQLSTWWWKLGIRHERIQPGKPQQNGRHERMHLTLAQETASPPSANLKAQQRAFDRFRKEYNCDRPHEALGGDVPADHHERSPRPLPEPRWGRPFLYPEDYDLASVSRLGYLQWNGRSTFLSSARTPRHQPPCSETQPTSLSAHGSSEVSKPGTSLTVSTEDLVYAGLETGDIAERSGTRRAPARSTAIEAQELIALTRGRGASRARRASPAASLLR